MMSLTKAATTRRLRFFPIPQEEGSHPAHSSLRTDLAMEAHEALMHTDADLSGLSTETETFQSASVTRTVVKNAAAAEIIGKAVGTYVTIQTDELTGHDRDAENHVSTLLAQEIKDFLNRFQLDDTATVFVVGLGNWNATPDNIGPLTLSKLLITRHLHEYRVLDDELLKKMRPVSALSPGVLGLTGMESADIVRSIVERMQPAAVVCVDALASTSIRRIGTTIQLSDAGINPGSGVGNVRRGLTEETVGVPVLALGVPTVIYATTIVSEALDVLNAHARGGLPPIDPSLLLSGVTHETSPSSKQDVLRRVLGSSISDFIVTPKQIDVLVDTLSDVMADGLNEALHPGVSAEEAAMLR